MRSNSESARTAVPTGEAYGYGDKMMNFPFVSNTLTTRIREYSFRPGPDGFLVLPAPTDSGNAPGRNTAE